MALIYPQGQRQKQLQQQRALITDECGRTAPWELRSGVQQFRALDAHGRVQLLSSEDFLAFSFRLLPEQRLTTLIQYNLIRGCATNMTLLSGISTKLQACPDMQSLTLFPPPHVVPNSLLPTPLQQVTPHEPWIDFLPVPRLRDNVIRYVQDHGSDELCRAFWGRRHAEEASQDTPGVIVWSDPWHFSGWELSEAFVERWTFLLDGCTDLILATNRWRRLRNEAGLSLDLHTR